MVEDEALLKRYNKLYLEIIMRYKDHIEEKETLYVAELPKLVTPTDESVTNLARNLTKSFPSYSYENDFRTAALEAQKYVKDSISQINLPIQFWLRPSQTISLEAGDVFDKAVLLCSLLAAMGNASSKIITAIKEGDQKFAVYCEYKDRILFLEIDGAVADFNNKEEVLARLGIGKDPDITAYEFNDKMYSNLA